MTFLTSAHDTCLNSNWSSWVLWKLISVGEKSIVIPCVLASSDDLFAAFSPTETKYLLNSSTQRIRGVLQAFLIALYKKSVTCNNNEKHYYGSFKEQTQPAVHEVVLRLVRPECCKLIRVLDLGSDDRFPPDIYLDVLVC